MILEDTKSALPVNPPHSSIKAVNLVSLAKGVLQAINFLSEKEADDLPTLKT